MPPHRALPGHRNPATNNPDHRYQEGLLATLRAAIARRRPDGVVCHLEQVPADCQETLGTLPLTSAVRSLTDCLLRATLVSAHAPGWAAQPRVAATIRQALAAWR